MDAATGRPRILASRADGRAGVSPQTSDGEGGEGSEKRTGRDRGTGEEAMDATSGWPRTACCGQGGRNQGLWVIFLGQLL